MLRLKDTDWAWLPIANPNPDPSSGKKLRGCWRRSWGRVNRDGARPGTEWNIAHCTRCNAVRAVKPASHLPCNLRRPRHRTQPGIKLSDSQPQEKATVPACPPRGSSCPSDSCMSFCLCDRPFDSIAWASNLALDTLDILVTRHLHQI